MCPEGMIIGREMGHIYIVHVDATRVAVSRNREEGRVTVITNVHPTVVFAAGSERSSVAPAQPERPPPPLPPPRFPNSGV